MEILVLILLSGGIILLSGCWKGRKEGYPGQRPTYTPTDGPSADRENESPRAEVRGKDWEYSAPVLINKGDKGECRVAKILADLPHEYTIFNDIVLNTQRGTTQIDHIVVSRYALFVIETKNISGTIYGDDKRKEWVQVLTQDVQYRRGLFRRSKTYTYVNDQNHFYSPVKQCLLHVITLREYLKEVPHLPIIPIIVFTSDADLSGVVSKYKVIHSKSLRQTIGCHMAINISDANVAKIIAVVEQCNMRDEVSTREHVRNIRQAHIEAVEREDAGLCPWCGGNLIARQGPYGRFMGCSNYPKCTYKKKL